MFAPKDDETAMNPSLSNSINLVCGWLESTRLSQAIQANDWVVPMLQTVHILAIAVIAGSALMIDLRLIGISGMDLPLKRSFSRFMPLIWWGLVVLLATGAVMIVGEPTRSLKNPMFQLKMALLIAAIVVTGLLQLLFRREPASSAVSIRRQNIGTALAVISIMVWSGIIFAGRWIAYYS
jgi:hypothetical protein